MTPCLRWSEGSFNPLPHVRPFIRPRTRLLPLPRHRGRGRWGRNKLGVSASVFGRRWFGRFKLGFPASMLDRGWFGWSRLWTRQGQGGSWAARTAGRGRFGYRGGSFNRGHGAPGPLPSCTKFPFTFFGGFLSCGFDDFWFNNCGFFLFLSEWVFGRFLLLAWTGMYEVPYPPFF